MKIIKYILSLFIVQLVISCSIDDDFGSTISDNDGNVRIVSRVMPFNEHDVATRAADDRENLVTSYDYIILSKVSGEDASLEPEDYVCVFYRHFEGSGNQIVAIDIDSEFEHLTPAQKSECRIVLLANYPQLYNKMYDNASESSEYVNGDGFINVEKYIADKIVYKGGDNLGNYERGNFFTDIDFNHQGGDYSYIEIPETGLPRMGEYADLVNFDSVEAGTQYEIPLKSLYAKMVFEISVDAIQQGIGDNTNMFYLEKYTVNNVVTSVDMVGGRESTAGTKDGTTDTDVDFAENSISVPMSETSLGKDDVIPFVFYLPERFLQANTPANDFPYDFASGGADSARAEDRKLCQRYKPRLVTPEQRATYVTLTGTFYNHQGHAYDVDYNIYLGKDNYSNFDIVRNYQYNNNIIIKGIDNSSDQSSVGGAVSIDHRVNITRHSPIIINFRRETLLDAHFEVRPLRISCSDANATGTVKVEVLTYEKANDGTVTIGGPNPNNPTRPDWIRLERSYGDGGYSNGEDALYCHNGELGASSNGKRKYFTYGLVSGKKADDSPEESGWSIQSTGTSVEVPLSELDSTLKPDPAGCVWVYVDECLEASTDQTSVRKAVVRVTYGDEVIDYVVSQHRLFKVTRDERVYYIEHEEEYLHNFDADDNFIDNYTEFEGMEWGLYNTQLSFRTDALFFGSKESWYSNFVNWIKEYAKVDPKYDFYIKRHDEDVTNQIDMNQYAGLNFSKQIINDINGVTENSTGYVGRKDKKDVTRPNNILKLQLNELPHSAIEYCYNRNKRKSDGTIDTDNITWYMPSADEIEDVMVVAFGEFPEFQEQFYWSCQPAYLRNHAEYNYILGSVYGDYYIDDIGIYKISNSATKQFSVGRARATRANFIGPTEKDFEYAKSGLPVEVYDDYVGILLLWDGFYHSGTRGNRKTLYDWSKYDEADKTTWMKYEDGNQLRSEKNRVRVLVDKTKVKEIND